MADTPKLEMPELSVSQEEKETVHNEALRRIDAVIQCNVLDIANSPPGGESDGDTYLVGTGSGDFAGYDDYIAYFKSTAYIFIQPAEGWIIYVQDEDAFYFYQGSAGGGWTKLQTFLGLDDVSDTSYSGKRGQAPHVNAGETALELVADPWDVDLFVPGKPTGGGIVYREVMVRYVTFEGDLDGSDADSRVNSTAAAVFNVLVNNASPPAATITFDGSTVIFATDDSNGFSVQPGDVLEIDAPNPADSTLEDISITLKGTRDNTQE